MHFRLKHCIGAIDENVARFCERHAQLGLEHHDLAPFASPGATVPHISRYILVEAIGVAHDEPARRLAGSRSRHGSGDRQTGRSQLAPTPSTYQLMLDALFPMRVFRPAHEALLIRPLTGRNGMRRNPLDAHSGSQDGFPSLPFDKCSVAVH